MDKRYSITKKIKTFLSYLAQNNSNQKRREHEDLIKVMGKEGLVIEDLCMDHGYIKREVIRDGEKEHKLASKINGKGLKKLEEYEKDEQKLKYSQYMLLATIGLLITTGIYVVAVYESNQIIRNQFISENSPTFYIEEIGNAKSNGKVLLFDLTVQNIGKAPGRILSISSIIEGSNCAPSYSELKEFNQRTLILPGQSKLFASIEYNSTSNKTEKVKVTINYIGIKESGNTPFQYTETFNIDGNNNIIVDEGIL